MEVKLNFDEFYNSWWTNKCLNYNGEKLSDYYDIFFSRFVTFNSLYNTIIYTKEHVGLLERTTKRNGKLIERSDKVKATLLMSKELTDLELFNLFKKPVIVKNIKALIDIIESKKFVITHRSGHAVPTDDLLILAKLKHSNNKDKFLGILELLYNVRCNLFHGSKGYERDQIMLLEPINEIIFHIVGLLYHSFKSLINNHILSIKKEIKILNEDKFE